MKNSLQLSIDDDGMYTGAEAVLNPSSPNSEGYDQLSSTPTDFEYANNSVLFSGCPISLSSSMLLIKNADEA